MSPGFPIAAIVVSPALLLEAAFSGAELDGSFDVQPVYFSKLMHCELEFAVSVTKDATHN